MPKFDEMTHAERCKTIAQWIRENTPGNGIAMLLHVELPALQKFVNDHLPQLRNMFRVLSEDQLDRMASALKDEDYPPFDWKARDKRRLAGRKPPQTPRLVVVK